MSIKDQQIITAKEDSILKELKLGRQPMASIVQEGVERIFGARAPGEPEFVPLKAEAYEVSNKNLFNNSMASIKNDLNTCFKEILRLNNEVSEIFEFYENQKGSIEGEVERLSLRLEATQDQEKSMTKVINFMDFYESNFENRADINYPKTDAFIDIQERSVFLQKIVSLCKKIDLSKASVEIAPTSSLAMKRSSGSKESLVKDIGNDPVHLLYSSNRITNEAITITVTPALPVLINTISFAFKTMSKCKIELKITNDQQEVKLIGKQVVNKNISWNFEPETVGSFTIEVTKLEAEGFMDESYIYNFILENIECKLDTFKEFSVHTTLPIVSRQILDHVTLNCTQNIPSGTKIEHYVGSITDGPINWNKVTLGEPTSMDLLDTRTLVSEKGQAFYGNEIEGLSTITKVETYVDQFNIEILPGYQMFKKEVIQLAEAAPFSIGSIKNGTIVSKDYISCETYDLNADQGQVISLSQYIYCSETMIASKKFIKKTDNYLIYLNNVELKAVDGIYSLKLLPGVNKLEIFAEDQGEGMFHNFNLKTVSFEIYSEKPYIAASEYTVNVGGNFFFKDEDGNLLIKNDIMNMSSMDTGIRFKVKYKCPKNPSLKDTKFAIMTVMSSTSQFVTPKVYDQTIIMR